MAKKSALVFGIIFIVVAILGFIPNPIVGNGALFDADAVHSIVHLIFGFILLIVAIKSPAASAKTLQWVGIVYLLVAILGFIWGSFVGLFMVNGADNWLHLVLGIVIAAFGFAGKSNSSTSAQM